MEKKYVSELINNLLEKGYSKEVILFYITSTVDNNFDIDTIERLYKLTKMKYRTLEVSKRLEEFNGNLEELNCVGIFCLDCPFYNNNIYCIDFDETELKILSKLYLRLPLKEE